MNRDLFTLGYLMCAIRAPFTAVRSSRLVACALATLLVGLEAASTASGADRERITNLRELRQSVESSKHTECDLDLEAVVCAADAGTSTLALQDETGAEVVELEFGEGIVFPGVRIRVRASRCDLIRRKWCVAIAAAPVVNNRGVHAVASASGRIHLTAGIHSIRLFYYNARDPAVLEVEYAGPGIAMQPIPPEALFFKPPTIGSSPNNSAHGLEYYCYEDTPSTIDDLRNLHPVDRGEAATFDIGLRRPREYVAMEFRGLIELPRAGDYTFSTRSDDGSELYVGGLNATIQVLSSNAVPTAIDPGCGRTNPELGEARWATVAGRVTFVGENPDGIELELQRGSGATRLWCASYENIPQALLLNARVRATGVYQDIIGLDGESSYGLISVVQGTNLEVLEIAPEQWEKHPLTSIAHLERGARRDAGSIAHLQGVVSGLRPDGCFVVDDGTGTLLVRPWKGGEVKTGLSLEIIGSAAQGATGLELGSAFLRVYDASPSVLPVLTTAAQVQQLSADEAAKQYPVRVRGVITCLVEWGGAVVQDSTRGVFFDFRAAEPEGLEPGDYVEIKGVSAVGDFAPIIMAERVRTLGRGQTPEPVQPNWNQLMSGSLDAQYAEVRGIITAVEGNKITLLTDSGKIAVQVHNTGEPSLRRLLNTLVRIRGCLLAEWDAESRQVKVGEIRFRSPTIEVDRLPMTDPFSAPAKTISDLLLFDLHASGFQRVKVSGQVVHVRGSEVFLMQAGRGLRFRPVNATDLKAGDLVDVVGIPELSGPSPQLHEAVARKTGTASLPTPARWPDAENPGIHHDSMLVQTEARLIGIHHAGPDWVLEVQSGLRAYRALIHTTADLAGEFPLGSLLRLSGVYAALSGDRNDDLAGFELLLNSDADIRLLKRAPWWNLRRLLFIVATLVAVLTAAAVWITQLHRKVEQRTLLLEREHAKSEQSERQRALEFERSRIARDLHDDLGSSLTEIRVLASTGLRLRDADSRSPSLFDAITAKARSLIAALDVIVWAVDPEENSLQSLADYLSGYASEYLANSDINCRFKIPVSLPAATLDGRTRHDLFLAVKETLHNVVQHSSASEVEFRINALDNGMEIVIADNGCGYDLDSAALEGHGLKNISERLEGISGRCQMESKPGTGTTVRISLPLQVLVESEVV